MLQIGSSLCLGKNFNICPASQSSQSWLSKGLSWWLNKTKRGNKENFQNSPFLPCLSSIFEVVRKKQDWKYVVVCREGFGTQSISVSSPSISPIQSIKRAFELLKCLLFIFISGKANNSPRKNPESLHKSILRGNYQTASVEMVIDLQKLNTRQNT